MFDLFSIEWVPILVRQELRLVLVLVVELLVPLQLLAGLVPLAGPLDLQAVHVRRDRLDVVPLHQSLAVVTTKEPHLHLVNILSECFSQFPSFVKMSY